MKKMKFLVIRFSSIGDIVLTSPLLRCLKQQVDNAEISFVTKMRYRDLLKANPHIDNLLFLEARLGDMLRILRNEKIDYIIDLHRNIRSLFIKTALYVPSFSFRKLDIEKWMLVNLKTDHLPDQHIVDRYFRAVSYFKVNPDEKGLEYFIPEGEEYRTEELPPVFRDGYVAFIISGTYYTKQLPAEKIAEICNAVPWPVILIGGNAESEKAEDIMHHVGDHVLNLAGKTTISESASLVRDARLVLTNDTGLMHIAAAFRKKILSFWGNTVPKFGMYPYLPHPSSKIMEVEGLKCRPCSKLGYPACPRKHFRCMNEMDIPAAVEWVRKNYDA